MAFRAVLFLALLSSGSGCGPGALAVPAAWIELDQPSLAIDDAAHDAVAVATLGIRNTGTGDAVVHLAIAPPFEASSPTLAIPAGAEAAASVLFEAHGYAPAEAVLEVDVGYDRLEVPVRVTIDDDADDDGHAASAAGGDDCDDLDDAVHPGLVEVCDGLDNDCDEAIDDVAAPPLWWPDADADGYGDASAEPVASCDRPAVGWVTSGTDCDDLRADVHPGALEIWYDGLDQDCDGASDYDRDGDGHDSAGFGGGDCADSDPTVHPDADEIPDGIDNDCDGLSV